MNLDMLVQRSVMLLRANVPPDGSPYYGCFSGGKDSVVIKELAKMAGVNVVWHYHNTTIDPPELVRFIKDHHRDVIWDKPQHGHLLHRLVEKKIPPTRWARWCCAEYKELAGPKGCVKIMGVRVAESRGRTKRWTACTMQEPAKRLSVLPARLWSDDDVWSFIRQRSVPHCSLYDEGFKRLGCVGCPLAGAKQQQIEFRRWPRFESAWHRAVVAQFARWNGQTVRVWVKGTGWVERPWWGTGLFATGEEYWRQWITGKPMRPSKQLPMFKEAS
jgi:phosphoadenosine phosphosulfate reductase